MTLSQAVFRKFPWRKVPVYIISQIAGGFVGALLIYADYAHAIDAYEGKGIRTVPGTASLFSTYAVSAYPCKWGKGLEADIRMIHFRLIMKRMVCYFSSKKLTTTLIP